MIYICNSCIEEKHTNIYYDMTFQVDFVYDLIHLDYLKLITPISYDDAKYTAFFTNNLSRYQ